MENPDLAGLALKQLNEAIAQAIERGDPVPPEMPSEGDIYMPAIEYQHTKALIEGVPRTRQNKDSLEKISNFAKSLKEALDDADQLTLAELSKAGLFDQFHNGPISLDCSNDFERYLYGHPTVWGTLLNMWCQGAAQAAGSLADDIGGRSNILGLNPKGTLVSKCILIFLFYCPSAISSHTESRFSEFVQLVHELATGKPDDCQYFVKRAVREAKNNLEWEKEWRENPEGIRAKIYQLHRRKTAIDLALDGGNPVYEKPADEADPAFAATLRDEMLEIDAELERLHDMLSSWSGALE